MKQQVLVPISEEVEITAEWLEQHNHYYSFSLYDDCRLNVEETKKLFDSKYAHAEKVFWPGWKANKFYGTDENGYLTVPENNKGSFYVLITLYDTIGPLEPCQNCGCFYRYLDITDLKYKCEHELHSSIVKRMWIEV